MSISINPDWIQSKNLPLDFVALILAEFRQWGDLGSHLRNGADCEQNRTLS